MQKEIFSNWFNQFIEFSKPSKEHPVFLLLDGHTTHTKNLDVIEKARVSGVVMLCFPPHTTHRLQPLNVSFMSPLSSEVQKWMQQHSGRPVTISQIGKLFGNAYMKAASTQTAVNGFRKTGIQPFNPEIFEDWMFEPSQTTDTPTNNNATGPIEENNSRLPSHTPSPITQKLVLWRLSQNQVAGEEQARHDAGKVDNSATTPALPPDPVTPQKTPQMLESKENLYNTPPVSCRDFDPLLFIHHHEI